MYSWVEASCRLGVGWGAHWGVSRDTGRILQRHHSHEGTQKMLVRKIHASLDSSETHRSLFLWTRHLVRLFDIWAFRILIYLHSV